MNISNALGERPAYTYNHNSMSYNINLPSPVYYQNNRTHLRSPLLSGFKIYRIDEAGELVALDALECSKSKGETYALTAQNTWSKPGTITIPDQGYV